MPLSAGDKLGHFEILSTLGAGGMGEVYRARDPKLKRDVALKVLLDAVSGDADRMLRFEREAEVLASLHHQNIAMIYGVEDGALVMELVEGATLKGPLPMEEALRLAAQIAEALEYAHERGVIHRDLKPANVKVTPDGVVKLLDFGLAKAIEGPAAPANPANSPTMTIGAETRVGMILGTAAYMSPEQARGRTADRRADIWSFGAVFYEMLTGELAFGGESVSDILASVLRAEPDWSKLPPETPVAIRKLLRRCLTKDRKQRLQSIGEARIAIEELEVEEVSDRPSAPLAAPHARRFWPAAGWIAAAVLAGVAIWGWSRPAAVPRHDVVRFTTTIPPITSEPGAIALSRDGSRVAFVSGEKNQIYVRMMDQLDAKLIPGTEGAEYLSFSPDGQWISYIGGALKKIAVAGGPAQTIAEIAPGVLSPIQDWGTDGNILYSSGGALMRVSASGGKPQTIANLDPKRNEVAFGGAELLPDGKHLLVSLAIAGASSGKGGEVAALNLQSGEKKVLVEHTTLSAHYLPSGHIVYYSASTRSLMAVAFDVSRMEVKGSPVPALDGVQGYSNSPFGLLGVSDSGTLAYIAGASELPMDRKLVWVDRKGVEQALPAPPRIYLGGRLSPDGQLIALTISTQGRDIWVYDLTRGTLAKITSVGNAGNAMWTPDGKRLIFGQYGGSSTWWVPADSSGPATMLATATKGVMYPDAVSPDGKTLIGFNSDGEMWTLPLPVGAPGEARVQPFLSSGDLRVHKGDSAFSPDGRWVAYRSDETGRREVYVAPYPGPGGKIPISTDGGYVPLWSRNGHELFYRNGNKVMAVDVQTSPAFRAGTPRLVFEGRYGNYDVAPDGRRFLMITAPAAPKAPTDQMTVVLNWFEELRRRVPVEK
jgi:Tol biopolymer transport system component